MRCLNKVRDELHDYTAEVRGRLMELPAIQTLVSDNFDCTVVHRSGQYQTEICRILPWQKIPQHRHPGVDSIDVVLAGRGLFKSGSITIPSSKRYAIRIGQDVWHGGQNYKEIGVFASCQRWNREPSHIALAWEGQYCTVEHEKLYNTLKEIA